MSSARIIKRSTHLSFSVDTGLASNKNSPNAELGQYKNRVLVYTKSAQDLPGGERQCPPYALRVDAFIQPPLEDRGSTSVHGVLVRHKHVSIA